jgi:hypothetical protein
MSFDSTIYFGRSDTNWGYYLKDLPIGIFQFFSGDISIAVRFYLFCIGLLGFTVFFKLMSSINHRNFLANTLFSAGWVLGPQFSHWLHYTPSIAIAFSFFPLPLYFLYQINKNFKARYVFFFLLSFTVICIADLPYALIALIFYVIVSFRTILKLRKFLFRKSTKTLHYTLVCASLLFFVYAGIISSIIVNIKVNSSNPVVFDLVKTDYTNELIKALPNEVDLGATFLGYFGELDSLRIFSDIPSKVLILLQVISLFLYFIVSYLKKTAFSLEFLILYVISFVIVLGRHLPQYETFYTHLFQLPLTSLFRYFYKWNIVIFMLSLIFSATLYQFAKQNLQNHKSKWKNKAIILTVSTVILSTPISSALRYLTEQITVHKSLSTLSIPKSYFDVKNTIIQEKIDYRIFYLPLNNWVIPERYSWAPNPGSQTIYPFIANLLDAPNNTRPGSISQHNLTIALKNLGLQNKEDFSNTSVVFREFGFRYIIIRNDILPEIAGDGIIESNIWRDLMEKNSIKVRYTDQNLSVYDLGETSIIKSDPPTKIKYLHNSSNALFLEKNFESDNLKLQNSLVTQYDYVMLEPILDVWLFSRLFEIAPFFFSITNEARVADCPNSQIEEIYKRLSYDPALLPKLGNCLIVNTSGIQYKKNFAVVAQSDLLSVRLKLLCLIVAISMLPFVYKKKNDA